MIRRRGGRFAARALVIGSTPMTSGAQDHRHMALALRLARRGLYTAHPNPRVGCVLVKDQGVVGQGYHVRTGLAHAEVNAISDAGGAARDATAYVTLEPCCHQGRTPPCTRALIDAGVSRVVVATLDPDPRVAGQGLASLAAAGIKIDRGVMEAQAQRLNQGFMSRMRRGRPWVRIKLATSLDGRTALANGESRWISSQCARTDVQYLRAQSSAIMTGSGTVAADDPQLTVRLSAADLGLEEPPPQPTRVVLSASCVVDRQARVLDPPGRCIIFTTAEARAKTARRSGLFDRPNVEVLAVRSRAKELDLEEILQVLARREFNEVQVEAGATLCGALLRQGLADELVIYMAPALMGDSARALARLPGIQQMTQRVPLRFEDARMVGDDLRIIATPADMHA